MLIHVFEDTPHHYIGMQSFYAQQCSINCKQEFWVKANNIDDVSCEKKAQNNFVTYKDRAELLTRFSALNKRDRVLFHGLFDAKLWLRLVFHRVIKQSSCVIWGYELYRHGTKQRSIKHHIAQWVHCLLIYRMNNIITLTPGDTGLVKEYLKRNNAQTLPYPLIGLSTEELSFQDNKINENECERPLRLLIGNSAAESNEHITAFEQLKHLAEDNIEIIVPLNYAGEEKYIKQVLEKGEKMFGKKFKPITQMLSKPEYNTLLQSVDMAVFAHNRQQGLYVAYAMLLMEKPLFLNTNTTSFKNLVSLGFTVFSLNMLSELSIEALQHQCIKEEPGNKLLMHEHFTEKALAPKWSLFLNRLSIDNSEN